MNDATLETIRAWFHAYAAEHLRRGRLSEMMRLKQEHSQRVAREARDLAAELGWSREDQNTAEALGLLHDTGRFSQLEEFGTFRDRDSLNHATRGYEVISRAGILRPCSERRQRQILEGILHHNALRVPDDCDHDTLAFVKLIRDADKLDICRIFRDAIMENRLHEYPEIVHHVDLGGPPTPALLEAVRQGRVPKYSLIHSLNDWKLVQLSWVYDMHYRPTFRRLLERRILEDFAAQLPPTPEALEVGAKAIAFARARSEGQEAGI